MLNTMGAFETYHSPHLLRSHVPPRLAVSIDADGGVAAHGAFAFAHAAANAQFLDDIRALDGHLLAVGIDNLGFF